jgi:hypothetical protein
LQRPSPVPALGQAYGEGYPFSLPRLSYGQCNRKYERSFKYAT